MMMKNILLVVGIAGIFLGIPMFNANAVPQRERIEQRKHLRTIEFRRVRDRHERLRYLREAERRRRHDRRNPHPYDRDRRH